MNYRRASLIILLLGLVVWFSVFTLSQYYFLGLLLVIYYPLFVIIPWISFLLAIMMFFMSRKWLSTERLFALLLFLPFLLAVIIPIANEKFNLYKEPTDSIIRTYFHTFELSQPKVLDLSDPLITYTDHNKTMLLNIKIVPELFSKDMDIYSEKHSDDSIYNYEKYFMNTLKIHFINRAKGINEINLRANHLIVHGYWGTELLLEVHYSKIKNEYVVTEPLPKLKLIEEDGQGFILYESDGKLKKIKVYHREREGTPIELDLLVY